MLVHRSSLSGGALCGAEGRVRVSFSGAPSAVTCGACSELSKPVKVRLLEQGFAVGDSGPTGGKSITGPDGVDHGYLDASSAAELLAAVQS